MEWTEILNEYYNKKCDMVHDNGKNRQCCFTKLMMLLSDLQTMKGMLPVLPPKIYFYFMYKRE